ncbi:MAG: hypothetical protein OQK35_02830 [Alphaproteobacteria bacterium]|nr:hypothetical protein [Alphaproteobacteria bacterium]
MKKVKVDIGRYLSIPTKPSELIVLQVPEFLNEEQARVYIEGAARSQLRQIWEGLFRFGYVKKQNKRPEVDDLIEPFTNFLATKHSIIILNDMLGTKKFRGKTRKVLVLGECVTRCSNFLRKKNAFSRDVMPPRQMLAKLLELEAFDLAREMAFVALAADSIPPDRFLKIIEEMDTNADQMDSVKAYAERVIASETQDDGVDEVFDQEEDIKTLQTEDSADNNENTCAVSELRDQTIEEAKRTVQLGIDQLNNLMAREYFPERGAQIEKTASEITAGAWVLQRLESAAEETAQRNNIDQAHKEIKEALDLLGLFNGGLADNLNQLSELFDGAEAENFDQICRLSSTILRFASDLKLITDESAKTTLEIEETPHRNRGELYQKLTEFSVRSADIEDQLCLLCDQLNNALTAEIATGVNNNYSQGVKAKGESDVNNTPDMQNQADDGGDLTEQVQHTDTSPVKGFENKATDEEQKEINEVVTNELDVALDRERPKAVLSALDNAGTLLQNKWPGLGAFTIGAAADLYPESMLDTSPNAYLLAAYAWMRMQYRDNLESVSADLAERIIEDAPDPEWANSSEDRALLMSLLAGTIPFHLRHRNSKLSTVIGNYMSGRFGNAGPLHMLCDTILEVDNLNIVADLEFLSGGGRASSWEGVHNEYMARAKNWLADDDVHRRLSFTYAQDVWIKLATTNASSIGAALKGIAKNSSKAPELISDAISELKDPYGLIKRVSREKIVSHSRRHLEENLENTRAFFLRVQKHLQSNPKETMVKADLRVDKFLEDLKSRLKEAKTFLENWSSDGALEEGARVILIDILDILCAAGDGKVVDKASISVRNLLACEFMLVDGMTYVGNTLPLPDDNQFLLEITPKLSNDLKGDRAYIFVQAAKKKLKTFSILPAQALVQASYDVSNDKRQLEKNEVEISRSIQEAQEFLGESVHRTTNRISMSAAMNLIDEGTRRTLEDKIEPCSPDLIPAGLPDYQPDTTAQASAILDFPQALMVIETIDRSLDETFGQAEQDIKKQVKFLAEKGIVEVKDIDRVLRLLDLKDILTAREYIAILTDGEKLPDSLWKNDILHQFAENFLPKVEKLYEDDDSNLIRDLVAALEGNKKSSAAGLIPETLKGRSRQDAAAILKEWMDASPVAKNKVNAVHAVAERGLGFGVLEVRPELGAAANSINHATFTLTTEVAALAGAYVPPYYGSDAAGSYQVIVLGKNPSVNTITQHLAGLRGCGILFARCLLKAKDRSTLTKECRRKPFSGLVVDAAMLAFLALCEGNRLAHFFHATVPYASTSPYGDTTPLPEEMFFGREKQRHEVINMRGGSLVYGGRRLGKTALLNSTKSRNDSPGKGKHVAYINIETVNRAAPEYVFWGLVSAELKSRKIISRSLKKPESIVKEIFNFLEASPSHSFLLLLDEADAFIEAEEERDYQNIRYLGALMEKSARRFRFIMAGLHNSQRSAKQPNNPLARLGAPIFIGPFTDLDRYAGLRLITEPMAVMGYEFEDQSLTLRILSQSNYYPVLIHIYCEELLKILHLEKNDLIGPPFIIRKEHLDKAYNRKDFHEEIRRRFRLTLELDDRYHLIALIIAIARFEQVGEGHQPKALSVAEIRDLCVNYGRADVLGDTHTHAFSALLDEMKGLGVLQHIGNGYVLRSANVAMMIGSETEVLDQLANFSVTAMPKDRSTERRSISAEDQYRRSPLTSAQEYNLLYSETKPVSVLFGNGLAGLDQAVEVLKSQVQQNVTVKTVDRPMVNAPQFVKSILGWINRNDDSESVIFMVTPGSSWNIRWLRAIDDISSRLNDAGVRILFFGDANMARVIANEGGMPEEIAVESIAPWSEDTLSLFLKDVGRTEFDNARNRENILNCSGMIGSRITDIVEGTRLGGKDLDIILSKSKESAGSNIDVLRHFGLEEKDLPFVKALTSILPVSQEEIRDAYSLVDDAPVKTADDLTSFCEWSGMMHLTSDGEYDINPLLKRCSSEENNG